MKNSKAKRKIRYALLFLLFLLFLFVYSIFYTDIPVEELKEKYANPPSQFLSLNGMEVHYRDEGQGLPVVLIHGTGASLHTWDDWTTELKNNYRVIRMDIPAFGLTGPHPQRDYSIKAYTSFLHDFLVALQIDSCYLAGNSLGGSIAWNFAADYPKLVNKLVLIDPAGYPSDRKEPWVFRLARNPILSQLLKYITPKAIIKKNLEEVYFDDDKISPALITQYHELTLRAGNRQAFIDRANSSHASDPERLKTLNVPTLLIWGEADEWIPPRLGQKFKADLPNAELIMMEKTGHVPMEERPEESVQMALDFFAK